MNVLTFLLPMIYDFMIIFAITRLLQISSPKGSCYKFPSSVFSRQEGLMKVNLFDSSYISILTLKFFSFFNTHNNKNTVYIKFPLYTTCVSWENYGSSLHVFRTKMYRFEIPAFFFFQNLL